MPPPAIQIEKQRPWWSRPLPKPPLAVAGAPKLAAPDHQGVVEQAALFKVSDEGRGGLVGVLALRGQSAGRGCRVGPSRGGRVARIARRARPGACASRQL